MEIMIELQKRLLEFYIPKEPLPMYPIDPAKPEGRVLLRDFTYRIADEMNEATTELIEIFEALCDNRPGEAREHFIKFEDELGDVWHFIMEFLIYANLTDQIVDWVALAVEEELGTPPVLEHLSQDVLVQLHSMASLVCVRTHLGEDNRAKFALPFTYLKIGPRTCELWMMGCWSAIGYLLDAIHCLKHKPWSSTERVANIDGFHCKMGEFMLAFMQLMWIIGKDPESIERTYITTNNKNHDRIRKGY